MEPVGKRRPMLFGGISVLILVAGILFSRVSDSPLPPEESGGVRSAVYAGAEQPSTAALVARLEKERLEVADVARRFLHTFLRYEVGEIGPSVRRTLRITSTPSFYAQLLQAPPRGAANQGYPPRATLVRMDIRFVSARATAALVSGTASRGNAPEEFSFLFGLTPHGWLATGPGE
ncbi:MAG: hypothetical protein WBM00_06575 [Solirubrobacterales bacterium]